MFVDFLIGIGYNVSRKDVVQVAIDPRCQWMTEKRAKYQMLASKALDKCLDKVCREQNIPSLCLGDYECLAAVAEQEGGDISMAEISRKLGVNPSSVTRRNRRLLECGLVRMQADETDERRYRIEATEAGCAFYARMQELVQVITSRVYTGVTQEEVRAVFSFTEKCISNMQAFLDEAQFEAE